MKKSESNLWKRIKNLKLKGQLFRIESSTINGIPEVRAKHIFQAAMYRAGQLPAAQAELF